MTEFLHAYFFNAKSFLRNIAVMDFETSWFLAHMIGWLKQKAYLKTFLCSAIDTLRNDIIMSPAEWDSPLFSRFLSFWKRCQNIHKVMKKVSNSCSSLLILYNRIFSSIQKIYTILFSNHILKYFQQSFSNSKYFCACKKLELITRRDVQD